MLPVKVEKGGAEVYLHSFLTSELREWLKSRPGRFTPRKNPGTHRIGGMVGPRVSLDVLK
jgi:hypothetical protein